MNKSEIFALIDRILPEVTDIRHQIHRHPELAGEEQVTAALIRARLKTAGLEPRAPYLETDVVAVMSGGAPGKNITLRADIDALPLQELNDLPYKSERDGLMHACGHDGHTATLLGAAMVLNELRPRLKGSVRFVFQPGEELVALGRDLVDAGALLDPKPDMVLALHCRPGLPVGAVGAPVGRACAAADFFTIRVRGKGGHGAKPESAIDPIVTAAQIILALQTIVSRQLSPFEPAVLSVCRVQAGYNGNVIPDSAEIEGTSRYFSAAVGRLIREGLTRTATHVAAAAGATVEIDYQSPYIPLDNNKEVVTRCRGVVEEYLGKTAWVEPEVSMGGEDFAYYLKDHPGALLILGMGDGPFLHNPRFNFNDAALRSGIAFLVLSVLDFLGSP